MGVIFPEGWTGTYIDGKGFRSSFSSSSHKWETVNLKVVYYDGEPYRYLQPGSTTFYFTGFTEATNAPVDSYSKFYPDIRYNGIWYEGATYSVTGEKTFAGSVIVPYEGGSIDMKARVYMGYNDRYFYDKWYLTISTDPEFVRPTAPSADWEFEDFNARKKITVKKEAVTGNPTNIPVKVDCTAIDNELYWTLSNHQAGSALKMTTADGDEIPCEAGLRNIGLNDTVRLFFLAPALSSTEDTDFYIYYSSEQNVPRTFEAGAIWLPGREGVWHDGFEIIWDGLKRGVS